MAVLEYIWPREQVDAKSVHMALEPARGMSLNTIQSTLERLFKKNLLSREKISHAYFYRAAIKREELMGRMIDDVVKTLSQGDAEGMLAAFVDIAAREDHAHLDRLEQLIAEYRRTQAQDT